MKASLKLSLSAILLLVPIGAFAQYSFTPTLRVRGTGACREAENEANRWLSGYQISGIPTRNECIRIRSMVLSIKATGYKCTVYYDCTPCMGTDLNKNNMLDPASTQPVLNEGVEVRNSIADYNYRCDTQALRSTVDCIIANGNIDYYSSLNSIVKDNIDEQQKTGVSLPLKELIPNIEIRIPSVADRLIEKLNDGFQFNPAEITLNPNGYTTTSNNELTAELKAAFEEFTGVNPDVLINKTPLTYQDWELLNRYHEFCDAVLAEMQNRYTNSPDYENTPLEMALYALHVYDDDGARPFDGLCSPLHDVSVIPEPSEQIAAQKILDFLNEKNNTDGFQADFYYDPEQDKYILAFRGTEFTREFKSDVGQDIKYADTGTSTQHTLASMLADRINESGIPMDKLTITGHSLGGGLALLAGLKTGAETYVYNPFHINNKCAKYYNLDITNDSNIRCFEQSGEVVVSSAEVASFGFTTVRNDGLPEQLKTDYSIPLNIGQRTVVEKPADGGGIIETKGNHSQVYMVKSLVASDSEHASKFIMGREMRNHIKQIRNQRPYEQAISTVNFIMPIKEIKRDNSNRP